jgi:ATP-dependent Clp protease protease subunit|tara:strand:+ start:422 stop:1030 length:609 start_codon:yes stop_codon:yes gene_type:complete
MATKEDIKTKSGPDKGQGPNPMQPGMMMWEQGIIYFSEDFTSKSTAPVINTIIEKNLMPQSRRPKEITLVINSPGGSVHAAFALIDTMKGSAIPIKTVGLGLIASCGVLTFMAGHKGKRVITPNTSILSHQYSWGSGGKEHELFARVREFELSTERMLAHYKACTGMSEKTIREVLLPPQDVWLSAKEAVKYGIADKVVKVY